METKECPICGEELPISRFITGNAVFDACRQCRLATSGGYRKCHDCGRPTTNYRCSACWAKLRSPDVSPFAEAYHVSIHVGA